MMLSRQLSSILAVSLLIAIPVCVGQSSEQTSPPSSVQPSSVIGRKISQKGLPNLGQVTPTLYRGALPTAQGIETLQKMGIDIVVDLRAGPNASEEQTVTQRGMRYVSLPSVCYSPRDETFAQFLALVRENQDKRIFVHCQLGVDRTGMAVASYRMAEEGWTPDQAMKEMQAFGFSAAHHLMCPGLAGYEQGFPGRLKSNPAFQQGQLEP